MRHARAHFLQTSLARNCKQIETKYGKCKHQGAQRAHTERERFR